MSATAFHKEPTFIQALVIYFVGILGWVDRYQCHAKIRLWIDAWQQSNAIWCHS